MENVSKYANNEQSVLDLSGTGKNMFGNSEKAERQAAGTLPAILGSACIILTKPNYEMNKLINFAKNIRI